MLIPEKYSSGEWSIEIRHVSLVQKRPPPHGFTEGKEI